MASRAGQYAGEPGGFPAAAAPSAYPSANAITGPSGYSAPKDQSRLAANGLNDSFRSRSPGPATMAEPTSPLSAGMSFTPGMPRNPVSGMAFNPSPPRNPIGGMSFAPGLPGQMPGYQSPMPARPSPAMPTGFPGAQPQVAQGIPGQPGLGPMVSTPFADTPLGQTFGRIGKGIGWGMTGLAKALKAYDDNKGKLALANTFGINPIGTAVKGYASDAIRGMQNGITSGVAALDNYNSPTTQVAAAEPPANRAPAYSPGAVPGAPEPGVYGPQPYMGDTYTFSVPGRPAGTRRSVAPDSWATKAALTGAIGLGTGVPGSGLALDALQSIGRMARQGRVGNRPGQPYANGMDHADTYAGGVGGEVIQAARSIMQKGGPKNAQERNIVNTAQQILDYSVTETAA
jgi:hypothetical protein